VFTPEPKQNINKQFGMVAMIPKNMKAVVKNEEVSYLPLYTSISLMMPTWFLQKGTSSVQQVPVPTLEDNDVLVKIEYIAQVILSFLYS